MTRYHGSSEAPASIGEAGSQRLFALRGTSVNIVPKVALRCTLILGVAFLCRPTTLNKTPMNVANMIYGGDCTPIKVGSCGGTPTCTLTTTINLAGDSEVKASDVNPATCGIPGESCDSIQRLLPVGCSAD